MTVLTNFAQYLSIHFIVPFSLILLPIGVLMLGHHFFLHSLPLRFRRVVILTTGMIGVPLHELSHAVVAYMSGLKVLKIVWFQPDPQSATLGYVNYAYQPFSIRQVIAAAATGIAPLLCGAFVAWYLLQWMGLGELRWVSLHGTAIHFNVSEIPLRVGEWCKNDPLINGIVLWLCSSIIMHSVPSAADIKPGLRAWLFLIPFSLVVLFIGYEGIDAGDRLLELYGALAYLISNQLLNLLFFAAIGYLPFWIVGILLSFIRKF